MRLMVLSKSTDCYGVTGFGACATSAFVLEQNRIAGLAADDERIFVLLWHSSRNLTPEQAAKELASLPALEAQAAKQLGTYRLMVFRPDDGVPCYWPELKGDGVPKTRPDGRTDAGPMQLDRDGVKCFGVALKFKGLKLLDDHPGKRE